MDSSQIVWSHATNSQSELEKALSAESPVNFIEADVILSEAEGSEPIMAYVCSFVRELPCPHVGRCFNICAAIIGILLQLLPI